MGKDFTPQELHKADLKFGLSKVQSLQSNALKEGVYPNLGFLFSDRIDELVDEFKKSHRDMRILKLVEQELRVVIQNDDINLLIEYSNQDVGPSAAITQWYLGKLDSGFHYRERNDQLFYNYILSLKWEEVSGFLVEPQEGENV